MISVSGDIIVSHEIDKSFDCEKFIKRYRDKYRVCW